MVSRRRVLLSPLATLVAPGAAQAAQGIPSGKMVLAIHQNTSSGAGYRGSLEGWARAGIRYVELTAPVLDGFLKTDTLPAARRVLTDNGLTPVSAACGVQGLWEPNPNHAASLDDLKRRCEMFATLGLTKIYAPTGVMGKFTDADYTTGIENMRKVGDVAKQFNLTMMTEFVRASAFISTLTTLLRMTRAAAHPNLVPLLDFYHFWSGLNKFEDLDLLRPGEVGHVHFQDVPDMPRELLDNTTRFIPGDGNAPVTQIIRKLVDKGYSGALSVELFLPRFQQGDPFEIAREIKQKSEAVMREARVL
jgi:sugar phosphate isomerase/epimerase